MIGGKTGQEFRRNLRASRLLAAARPHRIFTAQRRLESLLCSERLDCDVGSATIRNFQDLVHWIHLLEIDSEVGSQLPRYGKPFGNRIDDDNGGSAFEPCACRGAKPDGSLGKNGYCIPNLNAPSLGAAEARRHYVRAHQDLLVREAHWHSAQIGHGVRHTHKFGLAAIDGVAEFPAADRLPTVLGACTVLRAVAAKTRVAVATRSDGPGDHPLALLVATHRGTAPMREPIFQAAPHMRKEVCCTSTRHLRPRGKLSPKPSPETKVAR